MTTQIDISFEYNTSFGEWSKDVLKHCNNERYVVAYTKKAQKYFKENGIDIDIRKPVILNYDEWHKLYIGVKNTDLVSIYGGFRYDKYGNEIF